MLRDRTLRPEERSVTRKTQSLGAIGDHWGRERENGLNWLSTRRLVPNLSAHPLSLQVSHSMMVSMIPPQRYRTRLQSFFALLVLWLTSTAAIGADKPNIIYIMADDMGFSDIGCYGSEIKTPNLDRLADGGVRFTQFYNTARCCPTRASLMTGLYPHQAGVGHMMEDRGVDGYRGDLNRQCVTIAEVLKSADYRTYMSGKWHVTKMIKPQSDTDKHNWPLQRGFDRFYGTIHGAGSFFDPNTLTRDNEYISPYADPEYLPQQMANGEFYYTDAIADQATRFIREHHYEADDQPFFLYVAFTAAHWPMHALDHDIAKYEGKYDGGYDAIRNARYERMVELGLIDRSNTENWAIPDEWKELEDWEWDKRNMEVYAAMIDNMDQGIGRIVESLERHRTVREHADLFLPRQRWLCGGLWTRWCRRTTGRIAPACLRWRTITCNPI